MKKIIPSLLVLQILISPVAHAFKVTKLLTDNISKQVSSVGCESISKTVGSDKSKFGKAVKGDVKKIGCGVYNSFTQDKDFIEDMINALTLISLSTSLVNSSCKKTNAGKTHLPKSYTAGITHWLHKIAALIYIYAEVQSSVSLRRLGLRLERAAKKIPGQESKFQLLLKVSKEKVKTIQRKKKILKLAQIGFGIASAVELSLSTAALGYGVYMTSHEIAQCAAGGLSLAACGVPAVTIKSALKSLLASAKSVANKCIGKFKIKKVAKLALEKARKPIKKLAKSQVSSVIAPVTGAITGKITGEITKKLTSKLDASKRIQDITSIAAGVVVGSRVSKFLKENIEDQITQVVDKGVDKMLGTDQSTSVCIDKGLKGKVKDDAKELALASAVSGCTATLGALCPPLIKANCAYQVVKKKKKCACAIRSSKNLNKVKNNILSSGKKIPEEIAQNSRLLEVLAVNLGKDKRHFERTFALKDKDVCGIDYVGWGVRHDLECKSLIGKKKGKKQAFLETLRTGAKELEEYALIPESTFIQKLRDPSDEIAHKFVESQLPKATLQDEFSRMNKSEKTKVSQAFKYIIGALAVLKGEIIPSAYAQKVSKDIAIDSGDEVSLAAGIGLTTVAAIAFPKIFKMMTKFNTVLQRNPLRRGVYYLATYYLSKASHQSIDKKLDATRKNVETLKSMMKELNYEVRELDIDKVDSETSLFNYLDVTKFIIPSAYASNNINHNSLTPLCIEGKTFTTNCLCRDSNSCSSSFSTEYRSELFSNSSIQKSALHQVRFINLMKMGKVNTSSYDSLIRDLETSASSLNPEIAAYNLSMELKAAGVKYDVSKSAQTIVASLNSAVGKIAVGREFSIDKGEQIFKGNIKKIEADTTDENLGLVENKEKSSSVSMIVSEHEQKEAPINEHFMIKYQDIEKNKDVDIFKIISRKYQGKIDSFKRAK